MTRTAGQPYRFLDNYRFIPDDIRVFHGRKREAALLVSELTTRRLVVLFAPTGTGKSSLINAGVRPLLEATGYKTVMVRVEKDPDQSLRAALAAEDLLPERGQPAALGQSVRDAIAAAGRPLVIFLDQFEEFFLYVQRDQPERSRKFITDVAELYRDRNAGAHFAFSIREDFFVEMDAFRDEIPTIFQQNSALRLRAFQRDQARDAIRLPALEFGVSFDEDLISEKPAAGKPEALLDDLAAIGPKGLISPIHLQILCDTLWKSKPTGDRITSALYHKEIGPVVRILDDRFRRDIAGTLTDPELVLFARLLPLLRSDEGRGTKSLISIDLLAEKMQIDSATVGALIDKLEELRLLKRGVGGAVNWASDYLSGRLDHLLWAARSTYFRRVLAAAMQASAAQPALTSEAASSLSTSHEIEARYMRRADFENISDEWRYLGPPPDRAGDTSGKPVLDLSQDEIRFLFDASLEHGHAIDFWRELAADAGIDVTAELKQRIFDPLSRTDQAANAVRGLIGIGTAEAMSCLHDALDKTVWSPLIVAELGASANPATLELLRNWLKDHPPAPAVRQYLALNWCTGARALLAELDSHEPAPPPPGRPGLTSSTPPAAQYDVDQVKWDLLVRRVREGKLVPVIGMGSLARSVADRLSHEGSVLHSPMDIEFLADSGKEREQILLAVTKLAEDENSELARTESALAALPLQYYLTTTYDDGIARVLRLQGKAPQVQFPDWRIGKSDAPRIEASPAAPLVYHLRGHKVDPDSIVLTLQDEFSLLAAATANPAILSLPVQASLAYSTVVFFDFDPRSTEFQSVLAIFRRIRSARRSYNFCIPTAPVGGEDGAPAKARELYQNFLVQFDIQVVWGTPAGFAERLLSEWETFNGAKS